MTPSIRAARNLIGNPERFVGWPTYPQLLAQAWAVLKGQTQ